MPFDPDDSHSETYDTLLAVARRMALRWCSTAANADDAAQEAVLRLWASSERPRNAITWLAVVTRRLCNRDRLSRESRDRAEEVFAASSAAAHGIPHDLLLDVDRIMDQLSERDRRLLQYVVEGYKTREIAAAMDCAPGDVGQMVSRVRAKARRLRARFHAAASEIGQRPAPPVGPEKIHEGRCSNPTCDPSCSRR